MASTRRRGMTIPPASPSKSARRLGRLPSAGARAQRALSFVVRTTVTTSSSIWRSRASSSHCRAGSSPAPPRSTSTTRSSAYVNLTPNSALAESYTYDDIGNILSKSDFGNPYTYGDATRPSGAGPHAVLTVWDPVANALRAKYAYDPNGNLLCDFFAGYDAGGNLLCGGGRRVYFDDQDRPVSVTLGAVTTIFRYTPDGDRYLQRTTTSTGTSRTIYYVDKLYERVDWDQKPSEERKYVGASVVVEQQDASQRQVQYLHLDRLGSTDTVSDASGNEREGHGFDAFGGPRGRDWQSSGNQLHPGGDFGAATTRGFTGHEHLDETFLIHMNGRVYDYRLGRFLSVDPIISNPASSQSINPYSYIGNNPLSGVDPTGYECNDYSFAMCGTFIYHASDEKPQRELPNQFKIKVISETENGKTVFEGTVTPNTPVKDILGPTNTGQQANGEATNSERSDPLKGAMSRSEFVERALKGFQLPLLTPAGILPKGDPNEQIAGILSNLYWGPRVHDLLGQEFENQDAPGLNRSNIRINTILGFDGMPSLGSAGWLRPDLTTLTLDPSGKRFGYEYEIKPESGYGIVTGEAQLAGYLYLLNKHDPSRTFIPGAAWTPPSSIALAPGVTAEISRPLNGVIYYWVRDPAMRQALEATEAAAAAAAGKGAPRFLPVMP